MTQIVFDTIDPSTTSGNQLAQILNDFKDAVMSGFMGTSRPAETTAGGYWIDSSGSPSYVEYKLYTGTADIPVFRIDLSTGTTTISGTNNSYTITKLSADSVGPLLKLLKKRIANNGQVLNGDTLGEIQFIGLDDSGIERISSRIKGLSKDDFTSSSYGSDIIFEQVNDGSNTLSEKARLQDGKLAIGNSSPSEGIHVTNLNIRNEKASDDAVGAKSIIKKKRVAASGQVQNNDVIGSSVFNSTDDTGLDIEVAQIEVLARENHTSTAQGSTVKIKNKKLGESVFTDQVTIAESVTVNTNLTVSGDLTVNGTTTTINTNTLDVKDANILVNDGGTQATANSAKAGLTVEMSDATSAILGYSSVAASKFLIGEVGTESEVVTLSHSQTLINKSLTSPTLTGTPTAPTASAGTNTTQIATTAFANTAAANAASGASSRTMTEFQVSNWTRRTSPNDTNTWQSLTYGNNQYVAVASTGTLNKVMTSPDGIRWTARTSPSTERSWLGVAYGNSTYVAVASDGVAATSAMTSTDGITWTLRSTGSTTFFQRIIFVDSLGLFFAVGNGTPAGYSGTLLSSPDGITWTSRTSVSGLTGKLGFFNDKVMVFSGWFAGNTYIGRYSTDGITWNTMNINTNITSGGSINTVAYGNNIYIACFSGSTANGSYFTSTDGINWTANLFPVSGLTAVPNTLFFINGIFVAIYCTTTVWRAATSTDGLTWKTVNTNFKVPDAAWTSPVDRQFIYVNNKLTTLTWETGTGSRVCESLTYTP